ncbi:MAG: hypothetical protein OHK0029_21730 [Armatimonadaceae bacterium]
MEKVTVVITTFNRSRVMLETLDSVLQQTYRDFEVIVVNDGSTDDTAAVLEPFVQKGLIRHISQENQGLGKSRNNGLAVAQGKYICFLDDDDLWSPDKLAWQVEAWKRAPDDCVLVYGYHVWFGEGLEPTPAPETIQPSGRVLKEFCYKNRIASVGLVMLKTDVIREVGGFDPVVYGAEDWDMWIRLACRGSFHYEHRLGLYYRLHQRSMSRSAQKMHAGFLKLIEKHEHSLPDPEAGQLLQRHRDITRFVHYLKTTDLLYQRTIRDATTFKERGENIRALQVLVGGLRENPAMFGIEPYRRLLLATLIPTKLKQVLKKRAPAK